MKITTVTVVTLVAIFITVCHGQEEANDTDTKDLQIEEDILPAESQGVAYLPDGTIYTEENRPRRRYRGKGKRRRRQRKRLRTTTPSFIEEYTSHPIETITDQEDVPAEQEEVIHERRRPGKRRRRPLRRPQPFETNRHVSPEEEEYQTPVRNGQRRRRKGPRRKRIRVKPHVDNEDGNYTEFKTNLDETTPQTEQDIMIDTFTPDEGLKIENAEEGMVTMMPGSIFTPSEISEINYKLEPVSRHSFNNQEYTLSQQSSNTQSNVDESILYTTIPVQFNTEENHSTKIQTVNGSQETTVPVTTTPKFIEEQQTTEQFRNEISKIQPKPEISNNIESIIKNRKSLFSISRRLPPTSAVIRRRLRPRLQKNSTDIESNGKIKSPTHLNTDKKLCKDGNCDESLPAIKNTLPVIPSRLLPAGFMTLPEIISPKQLLKKLQPNIDLGAVTTQLSTTKKLPIEISSASTIRLLMPTTSESTTILSTSTPSSTTKATTETTTRLSTTIESTTIKQTTETTTKLSTTIESTTIKQTTNTTSPKPTESTNNSLRYDDIEIPDFNDGILDLLKTESGKSRLNRILELRNMTLRELLDHRERGSSQRHLSDIFIHKKETNESKAQDKNKKTEIDLSDTDQKLNNSYVINLINDSLEESDEINSRTEFDLHLNEEIKPPSISNFNIEKGINYKTQEKSKSLKSLFGDNTKIKVEGTVIPVPILEPTHGSMIQFPEDTILGAFPKFITDTLKSNQKALPLESESKKLHETINKPKIDVSDVDKTPRIFDSMPKFHTGIQNVQQNRRVNPDWSMESSFPRIGDEIFFHTSSPSSTTGDIVEDIVLLDENDDGHQRNHILGGKFGAESGETLDEDYTDYKKLPTGVKSAIFASIAIFGLAIFGFLSVLVSCRVRQRKARLIKRNDLLCEHLHEDLRSSQNSLTPVLRKAQGRNPGHQFNQGIHSNTSSNRHYYLWRTLRKTFQYE